MVWKDLKRHDILVQLKYGELLTRRSVDFTGLALSPSGNGISEKGANMDERDY